MQAAQAPPVARWNARASGRGQTLRRPTRCSHACHRRLHDDIPHAGPSLAGCQLASRPTRWPSRPRRQDVAAAAVAVAGRSSSRAVSGRSSRPTTERTGNLVCLRRPSPQRPLFSRSTPAKHASRKNTPSRTRQVTGSQPHPTRTHMLDARHHRLCQSLPRRAQLAPGGRAAVGRWIGDRCLNFTESRSPRA